MFKRIARKPVTKKKIYQRYGFVTVEQICHCCPGCGHVLNTGPEYQPKYCDQCGQKINFSGVEWVEDKELGFVGEGCI